MAAKKTQAGYELLVSELKKNPKAVYADLKAKADKAGHSVFPVMFGRAKAQLGLVKSAKWGESKKTKAKRGPGRPRKVGRRGPGRPPKSTDPLASLQTMLADMRENQRERERLVGTLEKVRDLIERAL